MDSSVDDHNYFGVTDLVVGPLNRLQKEGFQYLVECRSQGEPSKNGATIFHNLINTYFQMMDDSDSDSDSEPDLSSSDSDSDAEKKEKADTSLNLFGMNREEIQVQLIKCPDLLVLQYLTHGLSPDEKMTKLTEFLELFETINNPIVYKAIPAFVSIFREDHYALFRHLTKQQSKKPLFRSYSNVDSQPMLWLLDLCHRLNYDRTSTGEEVEQLLNLLVEAIVNDPTKESMNQIYNLLWGLIINQKRPIGHYVRKGSAVEYYPMILRLIMRMNQSILPNNEFLPLTNREFLKHPATCINWISKDPSIKASPEFPIHQHQFFLGWEACRMMVQSHLVTYDETNRSINADRGDDSMTQEKELEKRPRVCIAKRVVRNSRKMFTSKRFLEELFRFFEMGVEWIKTNEEAYPYPVIENLTNIMGYISTHYQKTEFPQSLFDFVVSMVRGEIVQSLNHRETCLQFALEAISHWPKLTSESRMELFSATLQWYADMEKDESYPKDQARLFFYDQYQKMITSGSELREALEVGSTNKIMMMKFVDSLFSDMLRLSQRMNELMEKVNQKNNRLHSEIAKQRLSHLVKYLIMIGRMAVRMVQSAGKLFQEVLDSPEMTSQIATCLMHTLDTLSTRFNGQMTGLRMRDTGMMQDVASYLKMALQILAYMRNNEHLVNVVIRRRDYSPKKFAEIFSTITSFSVMSEVDMMAFIELTTGLEHKWTQRQEKKAKTETLLTEIPEDFMDLLSSAPIQKPFVMPTSKPLIVDYNSISRWLINNETDPFNNMPLTLQEFKDFNKTDEAQKIIQDWEKKFQEWMTLNGIETASDLFDAFEEMNERIVDKFQEEIKKNQEKKKKDSKDSEKEEIDAPQIVSFSGLEEGEDDEGQMGVTSLGNVLATFFGEALNSGMISGRHRLPLRRRIISRAPHSLVSSGSSSFRDLLRPRSRQDSESESDDDIIDILPGGDDIPVPIVVPSGLIVPDDEEILVLDDDELSPFDRLYGTNPDEEEPGT